MDIKTTVYINAFRDFTRNLVDFTDELWVVLTSYMQFCNLQKKEHFTHIGKVEKRMGFLAEGSLRFYFVKDGAVPPALLFWLFRLSTVSPLRRGMCPFRTYSLVRAGVPIRAESVSAVSPEPSSGQAALVGHKQLCIGEQD